MMETIAPKKKRRWPYYVLIGIAAFVVISVALPPSKETMKKQGEKFITDLKDESIKEIEIVDYNESVTQYMRTVHVTVRNNSKKLATMIHVKAIYKDASGKIVGTAPGAVMNVPSGETRVADCNSMSIENAASYTVQLELASFD